MAGNGKARREATCVLCGRAQPIEAYRWRSGGSYSERCGDCRAAGRHTDPPNPCEVLTDAELDRVILLEIEQGRIACEAGVQYNAHEAIRAAKMRAARAKLEASDQVIVATRQAGRPHRARQRAARKAADELEQLLLAIGT